MIFSIEKVSPADYVTLVDVWEASVRATHDFITDADIAYYRPLILKNYLKTLELRAAIDLNRQIIGFMGISEYNLELLFIRPDKIRMGVGRQLVDLAVNEMNIRNVDVNEQNVQALNFYLHYGFKVTGRSETDSAGKPYPILYLTLATP
jgi:putative acetyltransferase